MEKYLKRLCKAILAGRFNDENYWGKKLWYGKELQAEPLFCSYGAIGFTVSVYDDYHHFCDVQWDGDLHELTIDGEPWKEFLILLYLEEQGFNVNKTSSGDVELEIFTDGGEDMMISMEKATKENLRQYIRDFDINEEVLLWWPDGKPGRGVPFDNIKEHYEDYEAFLKRLQKVCNKMPF